jgi:hypothetical protein
MRAFDIAHVSTSAMIALVLLMVFNGLDIGLLGVLAAAAGAAIACLACRWWPGPAGSWWRLWLAAWLFNPVVIAAMGYVLSQNACLLGQSRGWQCMGLALVVLASPLTLIAPTVAVITHAISRRSRPVAD